MLYFLTEHSDFNTTEIVDERLDYLKELLIEVESLSEFSNGRTNETIVICTIVFMKNLNKIMTNS